MNRRNVLRSSLALAAGGLVTGKASGSVPLFRERREVGINKVRIWEEALAVRPDVRTLKARLLANENPYGPSSMARLAMLENVKMGNRYGHGESADLISLLAEMEGVPEDHILLGPGSSDLLEKTAIVMFHKGGNVVAADPSYMSLIKTALYFEADLKAVPLTDDYAHDLDGMAAAIDGDTKLIYVCNPNNPTGSLTDSSKLRSFCETQSSKAPIFVDEAYLEFLEDSTSHSMVDLVTKGKDVIVSRTFSKIHGMAGLRVGYIVALPKTIKKITSLSRPNMGMNVVSLKAALASVKDKEFQEMSRVKTKECREYIFSTLEGLDIPYIPSYTSFIMFPLQQDGKKYLADMFAHGIGVRLFDIDGAPWSRVSMGTMEEMEMFVDTLKKVIV